MKLHLPGLLWKTLTNLLLDLLFSDKSSPTDLDILDGKDRFVGAPPLQLSSQNVIPLSGEIPLLWIPGPPPPANPLDDGPVRKITVLVEILSGIVGKKHMNRPGEYLCKLQIDRSCGPVIVDVGVKVETGVEKHVEGRGPSFVQCQPLTVAQGVVKHPFPIHRAHGHPGHIGIPQNIVDIIHGKDSTE